MNPYRCETCKNGQCTAQLQGGVIDIPFHDFNYVTGLMGCASHSNFQTPPNKILDVLDESLMSAVEDIQDIPDGTLTERERGEIIGLLGARLKIKDLRRKLGDEP